MRDSFLEEASCRNVILLAAVMLICCSTVLLMKFLEGQCMGGLGA